MRIQNVRANIDEANLCPRPAGQSSCFLSTTALSPSSTAARSSAATASLAPDWSGPVAVISPSVVVQHRLLLTTLLRLGCSL